MGMVSEQAAFLLDVGKLVQEATSRGFVVTGGELWRTQEQQEIYVKSGRSKTMASNHLRRLAIDLNFFYAGEVVGDVKSLAPLGKFWESLNPQNRWGGNFKSLVDAPHFERNVV